MWSLVRKYATPATAGLSVVSAASGVALFLHIAPPLFHEMHEWLGMALLVPVSLHLQRNWESLLGYIRRRALFVPVAAALTAAVIFGFTALGDHPRPMSPAAEMLTGVPLPTLAAVLKTSPGALRTKLAESGYDVPTPNDSLQTVAARAKVSPESLLARLVDARGAVLSPAQD
jgi:hypothetical protein